VRLRPPGEDGGDRDDQDRDDDERTDSTPPRIEGAERTPTRPEGTAAGTVSR
jgi:hypothetical protein